MQALFALLKQKYLFSRRRNFGRHHTSVFSIENNLQNLKRRLQVIEQKMKNYKMNSPLRFLGKYVGGSLISARPLCLVDDASDRSSNTIA